MEQAKQRINQMIGNTYRYENEHRRIESVEFTGGWAVLHTEQGDIKISLSDIDEDLKYFKLVEENGLMRNPKVVDMVVGTATVYDKLVKTAMDSIEKLQKDPGYIPQAEAINGTIKSIVDLEKTKIAALSLLK